MLKNNSDLISFLLEKDLFGGGVADGRQGSASEGRGPGVQLPLINEC